MDKIKWSNKKVISKQWKVWRDNKRIVEPHNEIDVHIYSWNEYELIKELYGENRSYYFLAKDNEYLCDESGARARMFNNIKNVTKHLEYILENGLMSRDCWKNPNDEFVSNTIT